MKHFLIVTNDGKDREYKVTDHTCHTRLFKEIFHVICEKDENKQIIREAVPKELDCAIVIGGDGSFIEAARVLEERDIPVLGINMGTLGYLTEVELNHIDEAIEKVVNGEYSLEERMMLEGEFQNGDSNVALNDIVVSRKGALRVIHFRLFVNGELLNSYKADGIILSTPTGSTAYNLSAGGPIVEPTASLIVITPICSHALNTSSIVLSSEDEIMIEIGEGRNGSVEEVSVAFDGADMVTLFTGDRMKIHKACACTKIMKLSKVSFLEIMRRKMKGN